MTAKIKHFIGRVPYATHTTHRIPAPRFDQTSGPGNTDLNPTDDERRILDAARAAAVALKMTFDNWVTMGRALQLLRKKADLLGARNAFNDLRDQNGLGDRFFNKTLVSKLLRVMDELEAVEKWRATLTEKQRFEWASPDAIIRHCPVFNPPPAANAMRKPSAYAKLERTNDDLARELDAAKAHIAELEAAQDRGSLFDLDLKNDKPDKIAEAIIGNVDLRRAEEIAKAILLAISIKQRAAKARATNHRPVKDPTCRLRWCVFPGESAVTGEPRLDRVDFDISMDRSHVSCQP